MKSSSLWQKISPIFPPPHWNPPPVPVKPPTEQLLLHPFAAVSIDLHHTILVQRLLWVGCVKVLATHHVPAPGVQHQRRHKATVKQYFLTQVRGSLLTKVPGSFLQGWEEDHQLEVVGGALTQNGVEGAAAVQRVVKGEREDEERTRLLAQLIQAEVERGLVQRLAVMFLVEHSADLYVHQRSLQ